MSNPSSANTFTLVVDKNHAIRARTRSCTGGGPWIKAYTQSAELFSLKFYAAPRRNFHPVLYTLSTEAFASQSVRKLESVRVRSRHRRRHRHLQLQAGRK